MDDQLIIFYTTVPNEAICLMTWFAKEWGLEEEVDFVEEAPTKDQNN